MFFLFNIKLNQTEPSIKIGEDQRINLGILYDLRFCFLFLFILGYLYKRKLDASLPSQKLNGLEFRKEDFVDWSGKDDCQMYLNTEKLDYKLKHLSCQKGPEEKIFSIRMNFIEPVTDTIFLPVIEAFLSFLRESRDLSSKVHLEEVSPNTDVFCKKFEVEFRKG